MVAETNLSTHLQMSVPLNRMCYSGKQLLYADYLTFTYLLLLSHDSSWPEKENWLCCSTPCGDAENATHLNEFIQNTSVSKMKLVAAVECVSDLMWV